MLAEDMVEPPVAGAAIQFDTQVLRLDVGWALNGPATPLQDRFSASFGQVTDMAPGMLDSPL